MARGRRQIGLGQRLSPAPAQLERPLEGWDAAGNPCDHSADLVVALGLDPSCRCLAQDRVFEVNELVELLI